MTIEQYLIQNHYKYYKHNNELHIEKHDNSYKRTVTIDDSVELDNTLILHFYTKVEFHGFVFVDNIITHGYDVLFTPKSQNAILSIGENVVLTKSLTIEGSKYHINSTRNRNYELVTFLGEINCNKYFDLNLCNVNAFVSRDEINNVILTQTFHNLNNVHNVNPLRVIYIQHRSDDLEKIIPPIFNDVVLQKIWVSEVNSSAKVGVTLSKHGYHVTLHDYYPMVFNIDEYIEYHNINHQIKINGDELESYRKRYYSL